MELHVTLGVLTENFIVYWRNVENYAETKYKDVELNNNNNNNNNNFQNTPVVTKDIPLCFETINS